MNHSQSILSRLKTGRTITAKQAMDKLGCMRLAARIHDLKEAGHNIKMERVTVINRFGEKCVIARYSLN
jgi:hypothetical protein